MAAIDELAGEAEVIARLGAVEIQASSIASAIKNLSSFATGQVDVIQSNMNELRDILGAEGRHTSSLGRPPWSLSSKSLVQLTFEKILGKESVWPAEMKEQARTLREHVINRSAAEQNYALRLMKEDLKRVRFTNYENEVKSIEAARSAAINDLGSDIQDLDVFLRGKGGARNIGKVMDAGEGRFDIRERACAAAAGLAYSRYLERGERASLQLLEAAAFVGGRRRRSPRKSIDAYLIERDEEQHAALYGTCLDFHGVSRFATDAKNWVLGRGLVRSAVAKAERTLSALGQLGPEEAAIAAAIEGGDSAAIGLRPLEGGPPESFGGPAVNPTPPEYLPFGARGGNGQTGIPEINPEAPGVPSSASFQRGVERLTAAITPPESLQELEGRLPWRDRWRNKLNNFATGAVSWTAVPRGVFRWFRTYFTRIVGMALKAFTAFMAFEVFNQMAKEKSGCYVQSLRRDGSAQSSIKICHDATWPNTWSTSPNELIKQNCQDCYQVNELDWDPIQVPRNLLENGCTEVGDPTQRPCRRRNEDGFNYHWDSTSTFDAMGATISSFERGLGSCLECATKLGAAALSGGIMSIFSIIAVLVILYVIYHIYKTLST